MIAELAFTLNTNVKTLHTKDLSLGQRLADDETPANKTARHNAIKTMQEKSPFFMAYMF
ncbi:MAG: hypothetical protein HY035_02080 [Nitrospirae bacterium]|nr:hypothetical protein [Nitrospirota bacterium]